MIQQSQRTIPSDSNIKNSAKNKHGKNIKPKVIKPKTLAQKGCL